jgi:hypothetical protein
MKLGIRFFLFLSFSSILFFSNTSCKKKDKVNVINNVFDTTGYTRVATRTFVSDAHPTTGDLIIYGNATNLVYVFKNFKTDDGPNLDIWLANDINNVINGGYLNLGALKGTKGDFYYTTPTSTASFSYIVVWCTDVSVKFGHAFTI